MQAAAGMPGAMDLMTSALCDQIKELCVEVQQLHAEHGAILGALRDDAGADGALEARLLAEDSARRRADSIFAPPATAEPPSTQPMQVDGRDTEQEMREERRRDSKAIYAAQYDFLASAETEEVEKREAEDTSPVPSVPSASPRNRQKSLIDGARHMSRVLSSAATIVPTRVPRLSIMSSSSPRSNASESPR